LFFYRDKPGGIAVSWVEVSVELRTSNFEPLKPMYAQKFNVNVVIRGQQKPCPLDWLDQFCMRNFTNAAEFDDTLPIADGRVETSFRLTPEKFSEGLAAWLTQRGKGEGQPVVVQVTADSSSQKKTQV
jgi:hypothetical protein